MEPYGSDEQDTKGLFTFYRQQDQLQKDLKLKLKSQNLTQILNKLTKQQQHQNKYQNSRQKVKQQRPPQSQRPSYKLTASTQQNSVPITKRTQPKISKSYIQRERFQPKKQQLQINQSQNKVLYEVRTVETEIQRRYKKYLSELEMMRGAKKIRKAFHPYEQIKVNRQINDKCDKEIDYLENNELSLQLGKLAIEPHEFVSQLQQLSKNFAPISLHKKEKSGLKAYRRDKQKAQIDIKRVDGCELSLEMEQKHKKSVLQSLLKVKEINNDNSNKSNQLLVNVSGLSAREGKVIRNSNRRSKNNSKHNSNSNGDELKSQSLPRLKMMINPPEMSIMKSKNMQSMSLQLQKSYQLRSRYQIRSIEKEDASILRMNGKLRQEMRKARDQSSKNQLRQHLSMVMKVTDNDENYQSNIYSSLSMMMPNNNANSNSYNNDHMAKQKQLLQNNMNTKQRYQQPSFNRHKQIFCKRDSYLKTYKDKLKTNIFKLQKSQQTQLKSFMEEKKKQIIQTLFGKLSLL